MTNKKEKYQTDDELNYYRVVEIDAQAKDASEALRELLGGASTAHRVASLEKFLAGVKSSDEGALRIAGKIREILSTIKKQYPDLAPDQEGLDMLVEAEGWQRRLKTLPNAIAGGKSAAGYKNRDEFQDKPEFIKLIQELNKSLEPKPRTLAEWKGQQGIEPYFRKYTGRDTLRNWINEAVPGALKRGRPKR